MGSRRPGQSEKLDLRLTPAAKRVLQSAATAARRSVSEFVLESALARAEDDDARAFYERCGFVPAPTDPYHLFVLIKDVRVILE